MGQVSILPGVMQPVKAYFVNHFCWNTKPYELPRFHLRTESDADDSSRLLVDEWGATCSLRRTGCEKHL